MYCIENQSTDPYFNLALEQVLFEKLDREQSCFMLWQNNNAIILGKHQNTLEEINSAFVREKNISVVRRLSGGGAVYHDLGNVNFTFMKAVNDKELVDFSIFCEPISQALLFFGVPVEISGRNDMTVAGKKFSGNAQYIKNGKIMHHGTILYDSNLEILSQALNAGKEKIASKAVKSVRGRVTNIRPYMKNDMSTQDFRTALKDKLALSFDMEEFPLDSGLCAEAEDLKEKVYSQWSWNYGNSPPYTLRKSCRFDKCGKIDVFIDVGGEGKINNIAFYGDFFGNREPAELGRLLTGRHLEYEELEALLRGVDISQYFHGLDIDSFLTLFF